MEGCKVVQIIEATSCRGEGTPTNPHRRIVQYWTFDGKLLFEFDNWVDRNFGVQQTEPAPTP